MNYSIIICTFNNASMLKATLDSIREIDTQGLLVELVIVNNNSTDDTKSIIQSFTPNCPFPLNYVFEPRSGLAVARNTGVKNSKGTILVFTDDDILFHKKFLKALDYTFKKTNALAVGGKIFLKYPIPRPPWLSDFVDYAYGKLDLGKLDIPFPKNMSPLGPNMAVKRTAFDLYGIFNENLGLVGSTEIMRRGEETEFISRLTNNREKVYYSADSIVYHVVKKERITKDWFMNRFIDGGKSNKFSVKKWSPKWWTYFWKFIVTTIIYYCSLPLKRESLTFHASCKSKYFLNTIK